MIDVAYILDFLLNNTDINHDITITVFFNVI